MLLRKLALWWIGRTEVERKVAHREQARLWPVERR